MSELEIALSLFFPAGELRVLDRCLFLVSVQAKGWMCVQGHMNAWDVWV